MNNKVERLRKERAHFEGTQHLISKWNLISWWEKGSGEITIILFLPRPILNMGNSEFKFYG